MDVQERIHSEAALSKAELLAKAYYETTGRELEYYEYVYIQQHPELQNPLEYLMSEAGQDQTDRFRQQFLSAFYRKRLSERIFPEGVDVVFQKADRYVHTPLHTNDFFELICMVCGSSHEIIGNQEFNHVAGDIIIIPPGLPHELHVNPDGICFCMHIRASTFTDVFAPLMTTDSPLAYYFTGNLDADSNLQALLMCCGQDEDLHAQLFAIKDQQEDKAPFFETIMVTQIHLLLYSLIQKYGSTLTILDSEAVHSPLVREILSFLYMNYRFITLNATASHFGIKPPTLSKLIQDETGQTFTELLRSYRMKKARQYLLTTDWKLNRIASEVGYNDTSQFIRYFRAQYGATPKQYQLAHRK